ncbi:hypothetical protein H2199_002800 [Coniosporium tulheliwenetii]|uniref:Uncharacterized protein n=1 Tax=Coniosporium tulheliwenetii TaxID=3383036 RepID=A0ACC2ZDJ8_9PEZI|nr:hypothetical protein H2199_002800 [Cladosporium sp. JES 115]
MFGPFKLTSPLSGGLLWKIPWRLSRPQKLRHRQRLQHVDAVVATVDRALAKQFLSTKGLERWKAEMPTEGEMLPKDKYTIFDRKAKKYRKGIHSTFCWSSFIGGRGGGLAGWLQERGREDIGRDGLV